MTMKEKEITRDKSNLKVTIRSWASIRLWNPILSHCETALRVKKILNNCIIRTYKQLKLNCFYLHSVSFFLMGPLKEN